MSSKKQTIYNMVPIQGMGTNTKNSTNTEERYIEKSYSFEK